MGILYGMVGRGHVVLAEFNATQSNASGIAKQILEKINEGTVPFAFLEDIHQKFVKTYGRAIISAPGYAMNEEFSRVLSQQIDYYSNNPNADRLNRLKGEMTQVKTVMIDNIEKVLERGGRLEMLVEKTSAMNNNSIRFKRQSRRYRNNMWWNNVRLTVTLIIIFIISIYILLAFICHGPLLTKCWR
ncbi:PREDICTED: vesicle-associated membrane protein 711-like isoform X2 [Lupinus angustifolius]|uniref:vesicle-associated membrane protein 711-like isoform X2 n=1 Tax=Lupinus angustifolius TaxID=3871 RepID=UPI00092E3137|nr:PREDICTED: vesicle-associated membrane protein 711-like isoform X2 [Lupinus angustifolius]